MFGIEGKPLEWTSLYRSGRYQTVTIDGKLSEPVLMNFSVPQGSVLGTKFYTMYTTPIGIICKKHGLEYYFMQLIHSCTCLSIRLQELKLSVGLKHGLRAFYLGCRPAC